METYKRDGKYSKSYTENKNKMESKFANNVVIEKREQIELYEKYLDDPYECKINAIIGVYRSLTGDPWILPAVEKAEKYLVSQEINHDYLWELGDRHFAKTASILLLGDCSSAIREERVVSTHTASGNAGLRIAAEYLVRALKYDTIYVSSPTWINHIPIFHNAGFKNIKYYKYWNCETKKIDFDGWMKDLWEAPERSAVLLQACAHNPTGLDPTKEEWIQIANVIQQRNLFPLFDCAYGGLASSDFEEDVWPVRYFEQVGIEFQCALSFSKNMGLYDERVGCLISVLNDRQYIPGYILYLEDIIQAMYMCPPKRGAVVVNMVLNNSHLTTEWKENIKQMVKHTISSRKKLRERLEELGTPGEWDHITEQKGLFSYTGLTTKQVKHMVDHHHVYMLSSGRLNTSIVNSNNVDYLAAAIYDSVTKYPTNTPQFNAETI